MSNFGHMIAKSNYRDGGGCSLSNILQNRLERFSGEGFGFTKIFIPANRNLKAFKIT